MFQSENALPVLTAYLARAGVASRRAVVPFIKDGHAMVNNRVVTDPAYRVNPSDQVTFKGAPVTLPKHPMYILLNKPNGYITTTRDEKDRKTVMDFFAGSNLPRLYPVGRLDRKTTGLLLFTNDGDCAYRLSHPKFEVEKRYAVTLHAPLSKEHFAQIKKGTILFDGLAVVDSIIYEKSANILSVTVHSGKNHIIRRIFEAYGYEVISLDRFSFARLKKDGISIGRWRHLDEHEIQRLCF
jgi:23S rRNA pseudouridine2605 synthase